jgi:hypothetical protein
VQVFDHFAGRTGSIAPDYTLDMGCVAWAMTIASGRVFVGCQPSPGGSPSLKVWNDLTMLTAGRPADITITYANTQQIWDIIVRDNALYVAFDEPPMVRAYRSIDSLSSTSTPDSTVTGLMGFVRRIEVDSRGTLYTLSTITPSAITIVDDALGAPSIRTRLTGVSMARALVVME